MHILPENINFLKNIIKSMPKKSHNKKITYNKNIKNYSSVNKDNKTNNENNILQTILEKINIFILLF